ncbi:MAG: putative alpha/beta superfamily hydrolase, partial [Gammaproteobacteria bacterium]
VCLPLGYEDGDTSYPVVYLLDGGVQQDLLPVAGFAALATLSGQYEEFILVGVETINRSLELTTPSEVPYDLEVIPLNGDALKFRRFVVDEVQPFIDARFRTSHETAVLGESLAGLFIVETFLRAPESFDHYIAVSPSVWWEGKALARAAADLLAAPGFPTDRSLYLTVADEVDIKPPLTEIVSALTDHAPAGLTWWYEPLPNEHHHTIYHPATLDALRRIFAPE